MNKKAQELASLFVKYKSSRNKWEKRAWEYEMVYNNDVDGTGTQFTEQQLEEIRKKHGIPLSVNIIVAIIEQMVAFLTATQPSINVVPVGESSKDIAYIYREIINAVLYNSNFFQQLEYALRDQLVVGHGILMVQPSNFFNYNNFNVNIKYIPWYTVYIDPAAKSPDYQDAEYIFLAVSLPKTKAKKIYNLTDEQLKFADSSTDDSYLDTEWKTSLGIVGSGFSTDDHIWVHEIYEKVSATLYILQDGTRTFTKPEPYIDENGDLKDMIEAEVRETFVKKYIKVGHLIVHEEILPITKYPFVIYVHTHNRSPYPYSLLHHVIDLQHSLNTAIAMTLLNAQRGSNYGLIGFEGTIIDKKKFIEQGSEPGGVQEIVPDPSLPNGGLPVLKQPLPLNNAWYNLTEKLIDLIEYVTGIFDLLQGNPTNAPETAQATASLQNFGAQRVKMHARRIDYSNQILGDVIIEFFQYLAPEENVIRYLDKTEAMVEIKTNVKLLPEMQQTEDGQVVPTGRMQESLLGGQTGNIIEEKALERVRYILGDIREGKYSVRFQSMQGLPTTQQMVMNFLMTLMQRMSNDSTGISILKSVLKLINYPETDKLLREVEQNIAIEAQLQQMQQVVKEAQDKIYKLEFDNHQLMRQNELLKIREEVQDAKHDAELKIEKIKSKEDATRRQSTNTKSEQ